MTVNAKTRRRWLGALCLFAAIAMLVADEFALKGRLTGVAFLSYWLVCFLFTVSAIACALADARAVRLENREIQRSLLESTIREIEKRRRPGE